MATPAQINLQIIEVSLICLMHFISSFLSLVISCNMMTTTHIQPFYLRNEPNFSSTASRVLARSSAFCTRKSMEMEAIKSIKSSVLPLFPIQTSFVAPRREPGTQGHKLHDPLRWSIPVNTQSQAFPETTSL